MSWSDADKLEALLPADEPLRLSVRISLLETADNFPTGISASVNCGLLVGLVLQQHLKGPLVLSDGVLPLHAARHFSSGSQGRAQRSAQLMAKLVLPPRQTSLSPLISCHSASTNWRPAFLPSFRPSFLPPFPLSFLPPFLPSLPSFLPFSIPFFLPSSLLPSTGSHISPAVPSPTPLLWCRAVQAGSTPRGDPAPTVPALLGCAGLKDAAPRGPAEPGTPTRTARSGLGRPHSPLRAHWAMGVLRKAIPGLLGYGGHDSLFDSIHLNPTMLSNF